MLLATLLAAVSFWAPRAAFAKATCDLQIATATRVYAGSLIAKAATSCAKAPNASCFAGATGKAPTGKKLKKCAAADITRLYGGKCQSRDASCQPAQVTTADEVAQCIKCRVDAEVKCLMAATFATASVPDSCKGSPSGAFLDAGDDLFAPPASRADGR